MATIVAFTTFGTTMSDFVDRPLGLGYTGGSAILLFCLLAVLGQWYWSLGSISVDTVITPKVEGFDWATITFSQTLGTALGDVEDRFNGPRVRKAERSYSALRWRPARLLINCHALVPRDRSVVPSIPTRCATDPVVPSIPTLLVSGHRA